MESNDVTLNPTAIGRTLGVVAALLVLASTAGQLSTHLAGHDSVHGLVKLFYVDKEQNIPAFFSSALLLIASLVLSVITLLERKRKSARVLHWAILTFGFLFMSMDEAVSLHEMLNDPTHALLGGGHLGVFYFTWVVAAIAVVLVLGVFFLGFVLRLPARTRRRFLTAGTVYLSGVIGMELIAGQYAETHGMVNLTYSMISTVEESLEMAGVIIFITAALQHLADHYKEVRFVLAGPSS